MDRKTGRTDYITTDVNPIWYKSEDETIPESGNARSKEDEYTWTLSGDKIPILDKDGKEVASESYPTEFSTKGNWAAIIFTAFPTGRSF